MLFGWKTEKKKRSKKKENYSLKGEEEKNKGHGRNGAKKYTGARKEYLFLEDLKRGDRCPSCQKSRLYEIESGVTLKLHGGAPIDATIYEKQKLRCPSCGKVYAAKLPSGINEDKFDESASTTIATLRYGYGIPFYRLEQIQNNSGVPLPSSTQWDESEKVAESAYPVWRYLCRLAAQGSVIHNDDTPVKILEIMNLEDRKRKGMNTTGIVSKVEGREIILFFSGWRHAGENLNEILKERKPGLDPPIQMCDALSRNLPADFKTVEVNCNSHGRWKFVELEDNWPEECGYIRKQYEYVFKNEAEIKERKFTPEERFDYHKKHSTEFMENIKIWCEKQKKNRCEDPESSLIKACNYILNHYDQLTGFLKLPGAPLENNICERILKKTVLNRKNSLFYKTEYGALIGDILMGVIHTTINAGVSPFRYLSAIHRNSHEVF